MADMTTEREFEVHAKIDVPLPGKVKTDVFAQEITDIKAFEGLSHNFRRRKIAKGAGLGDAKSHQLYPEQTVMVGYGLFDVVVPPYNLDELAGLYDNSPSNHAAINAKVANIVGLGFELEVTEAVRQRFEELDEEPLKRAQRKADRARVEMLTWLDSLNNEDTFLHTLEKVWTDVESLGNGYIEVGRTVTGEIGYIGHIPASTMRVRRKHDGFVQIVNNNKVVFFRNFQGKEINPITGDPRPNEIIHIKKYSPRTSYYGVPDTVAAATSIVGNELSAKYNVDFFENKATPRYIALLKGASMSPQSEDKLFRFLQGNLRGQNHRTIFLPLPADSPEGKVEFELKAVENEVLEASFIEYRRENTNETLMAHGVPRSRVGGDGADGLAAAMAADRTFKESVARPAQDRLEKMINKIIKEKTDIFKFQLKELALTDETMQSQIDERYLRMQVITPNEVRPRLGLPLRKDGDEVVDLKPQQAAEQQAQGMDSRQRDQERTANNSDSPSTTTGRNPKGEGRKQP